MSINGAKSSAASVISGIPQGSVLGPTLLVIYINYIIDNVASDVMTCANDTKIFKRIASRNDAIILTCTNSKIGHEYGDWILTLISASC